MPPWLPKVRVAGKSILPRSAFNTDHPHPACNVAPVFLDTPATIHKSIALIREAARNRADLVVFPETFIPAFPLWAGLAAPIDNHALFSRLASQSIFVDGAEIAAIRQTCKESKIFAHVGFNERSKASVGCIWNSAVLVGDDGRVMNHHRKLVPTFWEKLVWSPGDGRGLRVVGSERVGRVGGLICGENTNPLARYALMAQGEQLHISTWPAVWPTRRASPSPSTTSRTKQYNNLSANFTRTAAHSFEAKCFGVLCSGFMDKNMRDSILEHIPPAAETLDSLTQSESCFVDPTGARVGETVRGEEGIAYADLNLMECVEPKQFHDVVGGYQRFDVFDFKVDREAKGVDGMFGRDEGEEDEHDLGLEADNDLARTLRD